MTSRRFTLPAGADWIAGFSIAGLLLPEAVAYSGIAGAPPQAGVIALFAGLLVYGLLGCSRFAIVSSTSSSAAVLLAATSSVLHVSADHRSLMGVAMVLMAGVMFVLAGLLRLGAVSQFIAKPVLRGFSIGLALTIVVKQLPLAVGVKPAHSDFLHFSWDLLVMLEKWNFYGLAMLLGALLALRLLARWKAVPGALLVIAAGIALDTLGFDKAWGIAPVGSLQLGAAHLALPDLAWVDWLRVGQLAVALALILYAESYSSIRSLALRHGDAVNSNRDLLALGGSNMVSALFQGLPVGAGFSASSANEVAGAQSKAAGLIACAVVALLVWQLLPWMERIPEPMLAAIVIHAVGHSLSWKALQPYFLWKRDRAVTLTAFVAVMVLGVLDGLLLAMVVSVLMLLKRMSGAHVSELGRLAGGHDFVDCARHPDAQSIEGVLVVRPEEGLFFGNADTVMSDIQVRALTRPKLRAVVLSLEESPDLDSTSIEALTELTQQLAQAGISLHLARVKDSVRELLQRVQIDGLGADSYAAWSVDDAVRGLNLHGL
ncbi:SulP family inorganic anion transporter [Comamonas sp. Y33R10-2]|uniref:SulP family inorganic anion transporter n=1 Tax=Comamonas sp. Y33R10-2 TaxID=2853257 RepID=UPI001C5CC0D3|nr:SulP family inorganic anion transporter [Comamonas sp. Y33R10-2]QXZ10399.1 SulP family inorganic anion transporter [Comamonas sp. Y33R10-2]